MGALIKLLKLFPAVFGFLSPKKKQSTTTGQPSLAKYKIIIVAIFAAISMYLIFNPTEKSELQQQQLEELTEDALELLEPSTNLPTGQGN